MKFSLTALTATALSYLTQSVNAGLVLGECLSPDSIPRVENFDLSRYVGNWYEIASDKATEFTIATTCTTAKYTPLANGNVGIVNRGYYQYALGQYISVDGEASCDANTNEGVCTVNFFGKHRTIPNYYVLDTDYDNYSIVYNCVKAGLFKHEYMWILSRTQKIELDVQEGLMAKIATAIPSYNAETWLGLTEQGEKCDYDF